MAPSPAHPSVLTPSPPVGPLETGVVEVIDLHTQKPAQLERLLEHWRSTALAREHVARAEFTRDEADRGHLVLRVELDPKTDSALAAFGACTSPEASLVAALLDRPPRFRG